MRVKRFTAGLSSAVLGFSTVLTLGFSPAAFAATQTCTWTGGGNGTTFSDATNWSNCGGGVPLAGDIISFDTLGTGNNTYNLTNDLGVNLGGVTIASDGSGNTQDVYKIDTISFADGATYNDTQTSSKTTFVTFVSLNAVGSLTLNGFDTGEVNNWTIAGTLTLGDGTDFYAYSGVTTAGLVVQNGASVNYIYPTSTTPSTPNYPITLGGGTGTAKPVVYFQADSDPSASSWTNTDWTFANPLTLVNDAYIKLGQPEVTVHQTGAITGAGFAVSLDPTSATGSTLVLAGSPNNSATVLGTFGGTGAGIDRSSSSDTSATAPKTPNTGLALTSANGLVVLVSSIAAAGALFFAARKLSPASKR